MPLGEITDEDEFAFDSADEAELIALADAPGLITTTGTKRKASFDGSLPPSKRPLTVLPHAIAALTKTFGFSSFQLKQELVISRLLSGQSAAVVFPTGGGKSLCYQIPAMVFSEIDKLEGIRGGKESGVTLVVSPLISLMKDQVDALVRRGIKAATMDSTRTRDEHLHTCEMLRNGELKLLYCAPERLNNEGFVAQMKNVRGGIRLLAVDEAHCISEWGHAFRPDYLKISRFVNEIQAERVVCLTATATPRVAKDICDAFNIDGDGLFRTTTYRPNLELLAESAATKQELYPRLFSFLRQNPGPTIIYVTIQKQTEALADDLRDQGFSVKAFHAGMDAATKFKVQDEFMRRDNLIIVATIAFGMGIDKANIRNVVHFNIPNSLESYSQEIGRAGRDGNTSKCIFYVCGEDLHLREMFARADLPSRASLEGLMKDIFDQDNIDTPIGGDIKTNHFDQERQFDIRSIALKSIYAQLEMRHGLIRAITPMYTKYSFKPSPTFHSISASNTSPAAKAIRAYMKPAKTWCTINIDDASTGFNIPRTDIMRTLNAWDENQDIELKVGGVLNVYKVTKPLPRTPAEIESLVQDIHSSMEKREQESLERTEQMLRLITGKACFSRSLAQHFGDDLPDGKPDCGHCTWCMTGTRVVQTVPPPVPFCGSSFNAILAAVPDRDDPRFLARIAFGIASPRTTAMKLGRNVIFGSMADHKFLDLLSAFSIECRKVKPKMSRK